MARIEFLYFHDRCDDSHHRGEKKKKKSWTSEKDICTFQPMRYLATYKTLTASSPATAKTKKKKKKPIITHRVAHRPFDVDCPSSSCSIQMTNKKRKQSLAEFSSRVE